MTSNLMVSGLEAEKVEHYLKSLLVKEFMLLGLERLGEQPDEALGKSYKYGTPLRVDYRAAKGECRTAVLHTMSSGSFGREMLLEVAAFRGLVMTNPVWYAKLAEEVRQKLLSIILSALDYGVSIQLR